MKGITIRKAAIKKMFSCNLVNYYRIGGSICYYEHFQSIKTIFYQNNKIRWFVKKNHCCNVDLLSR